MDIVQVFSSAPLFPLSTPVRQLTGVSIIKMIVSYTRKPLLVGATQSAALTPTLNQHSYPPSGTAAAVGLEELKIAYAAAYSSAVSTMNSWKYWMGNVTDLYMTEACTINPQLFPFPRRTPGGALDTILK